MASQITGVSIVCSTVCSGADQRKHQSSTSLAFALLELCEGNPPATGGFPSQSSSGAKMFLFDYVILYTKLQTHFPSIVID